MLRLFRLLLGVLFCVQVIAADIVVGQVAPLSGAIASTGARMVEGVKLWFDEVNAKGGINGQRIRHVVRDDGYKIDQTIAMTKELTEKENAVVLIGFAGTANIGEMLKQDVLGKAGIALVAPYTGGDILRNPYNPWIFHLRASYPDETEHMVRQLTTLGYERIAAFYQNDGFGKSGLAGLEAALTKRNMKLVASAGYERNTGDVDPAVKAIVASNPQAVVMVSVNKSTAAFAKGFQAAGGIAQLFNISVVDPGELVKLGGSAVRGLGISQVVPYPYSPMSPLVKEYTKLAKQAGVPLSYTAFEEFIGAKVLTEGLRRAGANPTRERVIEALESIKNLDLGGFVVSYGKGNRIGSRFVEITVIDGEGRLLR